MEVRTNYAMVGGFVLVFLIGILGFLLWLGTGQNRKDTQMYIIYFTGSVSGLREGGQVRYRGIPVGNVDSIMIDKDNVEQVKVTVSIDKSVSVKQDAVASVEFQGITGLSYIQINGGTQKSPLRIADKGQDFPIIPSKSSRLETLADSAPELLIRIVTLVEDFKSVLSVENRQSFSKILTNLEKITNHFSQKSGEMDTFLTDTQKALRQLTEMMVLVHNQVKGIGDQAQDSLKHVSTAFSQFETLSQEISHLLIDNRASISNFTGMGLDQLTKLISDLRTAVGTINRISDHIERSPSRFLFGDIDQGQRR